MIAEIRGWQDLTRTVGRVTSWQVIGLDLHMRSEMVGTRKEEKK